jgi:ferric-dicitrate binding protein FerR (iron transport regulator)
MDNLEQQIQQFWENETSPEQRREILRQLEESGMEWKAFLLQYYNKVLAQEAAGSLRNEQKNKVWQRLQEQHLQDDKDNAGATTITMHRRRAWLPWMAAACVLLIAGVFLYPWNRKPAGHPSLAVQQPAAVKMIEKKNNGAGEASYMLPDSSTVLMAPGSSIRYREHFEATARNIQLEGRALFEVQKDAARPFTVTAHGFATTALGTRFIVDVTKPVVSIRLLRGKIVVNATADAGMAMHKMYLTPGQELRINTTTKQFNRITLADKQSRSQPAESDNGTSLSFEKTSLAVVFQRLSEHYKTPILYDKAEVQGLSFTGDFSPSDELELALKVICNMNQLSFTKEKERIVISKQQ